MLLGKYVLVIYQIEFKEYEILLFNGEEIFLREMIQYRNYLKIQLINNWSSVGSGDIWYLFVYLVFCIKLCWVIFFLYIFYQN